MTHSVTNVSCKDCSKVHQAVLQSVFHINNEYAITCPDCNTQTFLDYTEKGGVVNSSIPKGAIPVLNVKVLP